MIEGLEAEFDDPKAGEPRASLSEPATENDWIYGVGAFLLLAGLIVMLIGYMKRGTAEYSSMLNIGLLNDKANLVSIGGVITLSGVIFVCTAILASRIQTSLSNRPPRDP